MEILPPLGLTDGRADGWADLHIQRYEDASKNHHCPIQAGVIVQLASPLIPITRNEFTIWAKESTLELISHLISAT